MLEAASKLYNDLLETYLDNYNKVSANKREKLGNKYSFDNLALAGYDNYPWSAELYDALTMSLL